MSIKKGINGLLRMTGYQLAKVERIDHLESCARSSDEVTRSLTETNKQLLDEVSNANRQLEAKDIQPERVITRKLYQKQELLPFESSTRLSVLKNLDFEPKVIMDCGAFIGKWAKEINTLYPGADLILVEPNINLNAQILEKTSNFKDRVTLVNAALADKTGTGFLNIWDENSKHSNKTTALAASSLKGHVQGDASTKLKVDLKTIDGVAEECGKSPDFLKLDLQGAEIPALKGATSALQTAELCVIEFGCLEAYIDRTTPIELCDFMGNYDYVLYDIWDLRYRPYDGAMAGGDFVFVKKDSKLREHKDYF